MPHGIGIGASQAKQIVYTQYGVTGSSASQTFTTTVPILAGDVVVFSYNAASNGALSSTTSGFVWSFNFPIAASAAPRNLVGFCTTSGQTSFTINGLYTGATPNDYGFVILRELEATTSTTVSSATSLTSGSSATITLASTTGFSSAGGVAILTHSGAQYNVQYTGVSGSTITGCKLVGGANVTTSSGDVLVATPIGAFAYSTSQTGISPAVNLSSYSKMLVYVVSGAYILLGPVTTSLTSGYAANIQTYVSNGLGQGRNFASFSAQEVAGVSSEVATTTWNGSANGFVTLFGFIHA